MSIARGFVAGTSILIGFFGLIGFAVSFNHNPALDPTGHYAAATFSVSLAMMAISAAGLIASCRIKRLEDPETLMVALLLIAAIVTIFGACQDSSVNTAKITGYTVMGAAAFGEIAIVVSKTRKR